MRHSQRSAHPDCRLAFPALTHLALRSRNPHASVDPDLSALCAQLECMVVAETEPWFADDVLCAPSALARLVTLVVLVPIHYWRLGDVLSGLSHSLDCLVLAKPALSRYAVQAVERAFVRPSASVANLKRLALGHSIKLKRPSQGAQARVRALERVAKLAEERGVEVEGLKPGRKRGE